MPKTISLCTDGRGCKDYDGGCNNMYSGKQYNYVNGELAGCEKGYKEKPEKFTLKDKIEKRFSQHISNGCGGFVEGISLEDKAILREIVDYVIYRTDPKIHNSHHEDTLKENIYGEVGIKE